MNQSQGPTSVKSDRVRALRRLSQRAFRRQVGRFLAEGPQVVREAVTHRPDTVVEVFVAQAAPDPAAEVATAARLAGLPVVEVSEQVLLAITETVHPQGIAAVCTYLDQPPEELLIGARLAVLLDRVRDPGNAGTILRTADAAGADAVFFTDSSVDIYNGKCVRSSVGSIFHLPVAVNVTAVDIVKLAREAGLVSLAADAGGELEIPAAEQILRQPTMWLLGNEAHGLAEELAMAVDHRVAVPIYGRAESLNLAAAASVCLYASAFAQSS